MNSTDLARLLIAGAASPDTADADLFGQFVGSWDLDVRWFEKGEQVRHERGEWHFAWVLGGRAIQDIWIVPLLAAQEMGAAVYEYGTSLRFPDASGKFWRSTWHGPVNGLVATFIARRQGGDIVLAGQHPDGRRLRWIFSDIAPQRFSWRNEMSTDEGQSWSMVQNFTAVRRA